MESQNRYLDGSVHTYDVGLHKNEASRYPVPQHPTLTLSKPAIKIINDHMLLMAILDIHACMHACDLSLAS